MVTQRLTKRVFTYIDSLEDTNEQLVITLKQAVKLLTQLQTSVHDRAGWQEMIVQFRKVLANAEDQKRIRQLLE
jgi:hypothetical protein